MMTNEAIELPACEIDPCDEVAGDRCEWCLHALCPWHVAADVYAPQSAYSQSLCARCNTPAHHEDTMQIVRDQSIRKLIPDKVQQSVYWRPATREEGGKALYLVKFHVYLSQSYTPRICLNEQFLWQEAWDIHQERRHCWVREGDFLAVRVYTTTMPEVREVRIEDQPFHHQDYTSTKPDRLVSEKVIFFRDDVVFEQGVCHADESVPLVVCVAL